MYTVVIVEIKAGTISHFKLKKAQYIAQGQLVRNGHTHLNFKFFVF